VSLAEVGISPPGNGSYGSTFITRDLLEFGNATAREKGVIVTLTDTGSSGPKLPRLISAEEFGGRLTYSGGASDFLFPQPSGESIVVVRGSEHEKESCTYCLVSTRKS
jgi:hypothetical protein